MSAKLPQSPTNKRNIFMAKFTAENIFFALHSRSYSSDKTETCSWNFIVLFEQTQACGAEEEGWAGWCLHSETFSRPWKSPGGCPWLEKPLLRPGEELQNSGSKKLAQLVKGCSLLHPHLWALSVWEGLSSCCRCFLSLNAQIVTAHRQEYLA